MLSTNIAYPLRGMARQWRVCYQLAAGTLDYDTERDTHLHATCEDIPLQTTFMAGRHNGTYGITANTYYVPIRIQLADTVYFDRYITQYI